MYLVSQNEILNNSYKINLLPKLLSCAVLLLQTRLRLSNHRLLQKNYFILQNNNLTITSKQCLVQNNHNISKEGLLQNDNDYQAMAPAK